MKWVTAFSRILPLFKGTDCFSLNCGIFPYSYSSRRWVWWDSCSLLPPVSAVAKKTQSPSHTFRNTELRKRFILPFIELCNKQPTEVMVGHTAGKATKQWSEQRGVQLQQQKVQMQSVCWHTWTATQHMKEQQPFPVLISTWKITLLIIFHQNQLGQLQILSSSLQKYQVPAVSMNIHKCTQHLWEKTKPDKMLSNRPVLRELQLVGHWGDASGQHELLAVWGTQVWGTGRKYGVQK